MHNLQAKLGVFTQIKAV